jgi:hypothetical protein
MPRTFNYKGKSYTESELLKYYDNDPATLETAIEEHGIEVQDVEDETVDPGKKKKAVATKGATVTAQNQALAKGTGSSLTPGSSAVQSNQKQTDIFKVDAFGVPSTPGALKLTPEVKTPTVEQVKKHEEEKKKAYPKVETSDFVKFKNDEDQIVPHLKEKFKNNHVDFETSGITNNITVVSKTTGAKHTMNLTFGYNDNDIVKLNNFIVSSHPKMADKKKQTLYKNYGVPADKILDLAGKEDEKEAVDYLLNATPRAISSINIALDRPGNFLKDYHSVLEISKDENLKMEFFQGVYNHIKQVDPSNTLSKEHIERLLDSSISNKVASDKANLKREIYNTSLESFKGDKKAMTKFFEERDAEKLNPEEKEIFKNERVLSALEAEYRSISAKEKTTTDPKVKMNLQNEKQALINRISTTKAEVSRKRGEYFGEDESRLKSNLVYDPYTGAVLDPEKEVDARKIKAMRLEDMGSAVSSKVKEYSVPLYKDKLADLYARNAAEYSEWVKEGEKKIEVEVSPNSSIYHNLVRRGYTANVSAKKGEGFVKKVKDIFSGEAQSEIHKFSVPISVLARIGDPSIFKEENLIREHSIRGRDIVVEKAALKELHLLKRDPSSIGTSKMGRAFEEVGDILYHSVVQRKPEDRVTTTGKLDMMQTVFADNNIQVNEKQKENFRKSLSEEVTVGVGNFVPMIVELAAISAATEGVGGIIQVSSTGARMLEGIRALQKGSIVDKGIYHILHAGLEEFKMNMADFHLGGGAAFYGVGAATPNFGFRGKYSYVNNILNKVVKGGLVGAGSSEVAGLTEKFIQDVRNEASFSKYLEENYADFDEVEKRFIVNGLTFASIGVSHLKVNDIKTNRQKQVLLEKIELMVAENASKPKEQKMSDGKLENLRQTHSLLTHELAFANKVDILSDPIKAEAYLNDISKPIKDAFGGELDIRFADEGELKKGSTAEFLESKVDGGKDLVIIDREKFSNGKIPHEVFHAALSKKFKENPDLAKKMAASILQSINNGAQGEALSILKKKVNEYYSENQKEITDRPEEFLANLIEFVSNEGYRSTFTSGGSNFITETFKNIKQDVVNFAERNLGKKPSINSGSDLINFFERFAGNIKEGKFDADQLKKLRSVADSDFFKNIDISDFKEFEGIAKEAANEAGKSSKDIDMESLSKEKQELLNKQRAIADEYIGKEKDERFANEVAKNSKRIREITEIVNRTDREPAQEGVSQKNVDISKRNRELITAIKNPETNPRVADRMKEDLLKNNRGLIDNQVKRFFEIGDEQGYTKEDLKADVIGEFFKLMNTFDPAKNENFGAYANKILPVRVNGLFKKSSIVEDVIGKERTIAESLSKEGAGDLTSEFGISDEFDTGAPQKVKPKLSEKLGVTPELSKTIEDGLTKILGSRLPEVTSKDFKKELTQSVQDILRPEVLKLFGAGQAYKDYVYKNWEALYESIPLSTALKKFQFMTEPVLDANGKQKRETFMVDGNGNGKGIFKKRDISKKEFVDYFFGDGVGKSTVNARRTSLIGNTAVELSFDKMIEMFKANENFTKQFEEKQELLGNNLKENYLAEIAKQLDRSLYDSKSSKEIFEKYKDRTIDVQRFIEELYLPMYVNGASHESIKEITLARNSDFEAFFDIIEPRLEAINERVSKMSDLEKLKLAEGGMSQAEAEAFSVIKQEFKDFNELREVVNRSIEDYNLDITEESKKRLPIKQLSMKDPANREAAVNYMLEISKSLPKDIANLSLTVSMFSDHGYNLFSGKVSDIRKEVAKWEKEQGESIGVERESGVDVEKAKRLQSSKIEKAKKAIVDITEADKKNPEKLKEISSQIDQLLNEEGRDKARQEVFNVIAKTISEHYNDPNISEVERQNRGNLAFTLFQKQTNLSGAAVRQYASYSSVSLTPGSLTKKMGLHGEHSLPLIKFSGGFLNSMATNNTNSFLGAIGKVSKMTMLNADLATLIDSRNKTGLGKGQTLTMIPEAKFVLEGGHASDILMIKEGKTLDRWLFEEAFKAEVKSDLGVFYADTVFKNTNTLAVDLLKSKVDNNTKLNIDELEKWNEILKEGASGLDVSAGLADLAVRLENRESYDKLRGSMLETASSIGYDLKSKSSKEIEENFRDIDKALKVSRDGDAPIKKIRVFDFDDTLAKTKSNVLFEMPDGTKGKINAEEFAKEGESLKEAGAKFDFSEFDKVVEGQKGPMFEVAKAIADKRGNEDLFVLTARSPESRFAIHEFLKGVGLELKPENVVGLGDSAAEAKALWMAKKTGEGYNDFYFADDAIKNVKAVKEALSVYDVKSRSQHIKSSKDISEEFNLMLEQKTGVSATKTFTEAKAFMAGGGKGRFKFFIPPNAEDFSGLLYNFLPKGEAGNKAMEFFKETLFDPFSRGIRDFDTYKINVLKDYKTTKDHFGVSNKKLGKNVPGSDFTYDQAVRLFLWEKQGAEVEGISAKDMKVLRDAVQEDPNLLAFAHTLNRLTKHVDGYVPYEKSWVGGTTGTDILNYVNDVKRKEYLESWQKNADLIFSSENLNKIQATQGLSYRHALENSLARMKSGRNRVSGTDAVTNRFMDWVNGSTAAIMFLNTRSALLQTVSAINFVNWHDNNVYKAGKAFANQPQYWKDFAELINSDYLVERRGGLKMDINSDEIASVAAGKGGVQKAIAKLQEKGFVMTKYADSFAIAIGGSAFYRNRIKTYEKQGLNEHEAKKKAMIDFMETSEESQQSSRPDKISQIQSSSLGRLIFAFGNTPMQYTRLTKKAFLDLTQGRGDWKTNASKIMYYGVAQNILFSSLQSGMFSVLFGDDEEGKYELLKDKKAASTVNSALDGILRGIGLYGAIASVMKNTAIAVYDMEQTGKRDPYKVPEAALSISPPLSDKFKKVVAAGKTYTYKQEREKVKTAGLSLENPALMAGAKLVDATTNLPADRIIQKIENLKLAMSEHTENWEKLSLILGYNKYNLDIDIPTPKKSKLTESQQKKLEKMKAFNPALTEEEFISIKHIDTEPEKKDKPFTWLGALEDRPAKPLIPKKHMKAYQKMKKFNPALTEREFLEIKNITPEE